MNWINNKKKIFTLDRYAFSDFLVLSRNVCVLSSRRHQDSIMFGHQGLMPGESKGTGARHFSLYKVVMNKLNVMK